MIVIKAMTIPEAVSITNIGQETMLAAKPAGEMERFYVRSSSPSLLYPYISSFCD